jgi:cell wall-associated NlpC family hydrolase
MWPGKPWVESNGGKFGAPTGTICPLAGFRRYLILNSVDAQWITTKKDWREAKKRYKEFEKLRTEDKSKDAHASHHPADQSHSGSYSEEMDEMRCILYSHGGSSANPENFDCGL